MVGKSWQQDLREAGHIAESGSRREDVSASVHAQS